MKPVLIITVIVLLAAGTVVAHNRPVADLKNLPEGQQVVTVAFCRGEYDVSLADGNTRKFKEYDLAFKSDSGANGPNPGTPVLVPTGRVRDRAFIVFSDLDELRLAFKRKLVIRRAC